MRSPASLALFPGPFCAPCPIERCAERDTGAACDDAGIELPIVHPGVPDVFDQWFDLAPRPVACSERIEPPGLPPYVTVLPREARSAARQLPSTAVAFTLADYLVLINRAERLGTTVREMIGSGARRLVVIGADPDRVCLRHWYEWPNVREHLQRHAADLVVGPDLGFYERDQPATRMFAFNAHTVMYRDLVARGIPALPPIGWVYPRDVDRFVAWANENKVPGAFLDLQNRRGRSFDTTVADLASFADRLPPAFLWVIGGVQRAGSWSALQRTLGNARFTSSGPWHYARNNYVVEPGTLRVLPTDLPVDGALAASVEALTEVAAIVTGLLRRERAAVREVRQLALAFEFPEKEQAVR